MPGRAINNHFLDNISTLGSRLAKCPWKCLESCDIKNAGYCLSIALNNARIGKLDEGYAFAGASAYKVKEIISVKRLIEQINDEYSAALNN